VRKDIIEGSYNIATQEIVPPVALAQQIYRVESPPLQLIEIPSHSCRITHDETMAPEPRIVTILYKPQLGHGKSGNHSGSEVGFEEICPDVTHSAEIKL
jgi:hypothetical protein